MFLPQQSFLFQIREGTTVSWVAQCECIRFSLILSMTLLSSSLFKSNSSNSHLLLPSFLQCTFWKALRSHSCAPLGCEPVQLSEDFCCLLSGTGWDTQYTGAVPAALLCRACCCWFVQPVSWRSKPHRRAKPDFSGGKRLPEEYETMASKRGKIEEGVVFCAGYGF